MPLEYIDWMTRETLRANPHKLYVFGDNAQRTGLGGQAGACRGEPNAIGVATKWSPTNEDAAYFSDDDNAAWDAVRKDLSRVTRALCDGKTIVVPKDGIGTGLSQMPQRCPRLLAYINSVLFP